jgi:hypothetical protein
MKSFLLAFPIYAQSNGQPDPIKISRQNGHPLEQADPATIALALTAAPETPPPPPIEWWGWMKLPAGVQGRMAEFFDRTLKAQAP